MRVKQAIPVKASVVGGQAPRKSGLLSPGPRWQPAERAGNKGCFSAQQPVAKVKATAPAVSFLLLSCSLPKPNPNGLGAHAHSASFSNSEHPRDMVLLF